MQSVGTIGNVNPLVAPAPSARRLDGAEPGRAVPRQAMREEATPISIERASGTRLLEIAPAWRDLVSRAHEPNVFMNPALIEVAGRKLPLLCVTLLAWRGKELVGLWAFSIGTPAVFPVPTLNAPAMPHSYLATPVIDRDCGESTVAALLDFIARDSSLPKIIALNPIVADGPTMQALVRALNARGSKPFVLTQGQRPILKSELDGKQYLEQALSSASRKKLRQHRRRLEEKGKLELNVWDTPESTQEALEDFLRLEASGWKGRGGTALLCDQTEARFVRGMMSALAEHGDAAIHALYLDGKPIGMQIVLRAGPVAFTWKTAYDETIRDFSPGMLLLEDYTRAFLADKGIAFVDSCAYDDSGFMAAWSERYTIAQVWIHAGRGGSMGFLLLCRLQKAASALRAVAKDFSRSWRRTWKKR